MLETQIKEGVNVPEYKTKGAAGFDLQADNIIAIYEGLEKIDLPILEDVQSDFNKHLPYILKPNQRVLFGTGIKVYLPHNTEMQIRSRSGCTLQQGLVVLNSPGTIDSDYRGEIGIILGCCGNFDVKIKKGDRIAQGVFKYVEQASFKVVTDFRSDTDRGEGGYGSTGK